MKKQLTLTIIIIGLLIGSISSKKNILTYLKKKKPYYFLQEGVYFNKNNIKKEISPHIIEHKNDKYYVYVGITKSKEIATKLLRIYENMGYKIDLKERYHASETFDNNVDQYDLLIHAASDKDEILTIEEVVLANYEETKKNSSKN